MAKTASEAPSTSGVVLDFSEVKGFDPLSPEPKYKLRVQKLELGTSKEQKPKVHCEMIIESPEEVQMEQWIEDEESEGGMKKVGPATDADGEPIMTNAKGRLLFREFSLEKKALPFLHEFIRAVAPESKLDEAFSFVPDNYIGLACLGKIYNEAYDGQVNARIKRMYPLAEGED